jgi:hypothetical protein
MRRAAWIVLLCFAGCLSETAESDSSILPLTEGNEWRYLRTRYVRGDVTSVDTFTVTVSRSPTAGQYWIVRSSVDGRDSVLVTPDGNERINRLDAGRTVRYIDLDERTTVAMFFPTLSPLHTRFTERAERLNDSTVRFLANARDAKRMHQHIELLDDAGEVALKLDFQHAFVAGLGPHHARFVADLSQCQACSLISEFYTYELVAAVVLK